MKKLELRNWLAQDELNAEIAIAKLKLRNMNDMVYPICQFFYQRNENSQYTYLGFADLYLPEVSKVLGLVFKLLATNALFGKGSVFDDESTYITKKAYN